MKFILALILLISLTSCEDDKKVIIYHSITDEDAWYDRVTHFEYNSHEYILFDKPYANISGIVHNPDCKYCKHKN